MRYIPKENKHEIILFPIHTAAGWAITIYYFSKGASAFLHTDLFLGFLSFIQQFNPPPSPILPPTEPTVPSVQQKTFWAHYSACGDAVSDTLSAKNPKFVLYSFHSNFLSGKLSESTTSPIKFYHQSKVMMKFFVSKLCGKSNRWRYHWLQTSIENQFKQ